MENPFKNVVITDEWHGRTQEWPLAWFIENHMGTDIVASHVAEVVLRKATGMPWAGAEYLNGMFLRMIKSKLSDIGRQHSLQFEKAGRAFIHDLAKEGKVKIGCVRYTSDTRNNGKTETWYINLVSIAVAQYAGFTVASVCFTKEKVGINYRIPFRKIRGILGHRLMNGRCLVCRSKEEDIDLMLRYAFEKIMMHGKIDDNDFPESFRKACRNGLELLDIEVLPIRNDEGDKRRLLTI